VILYFINRKNELFNLKNKLEEIEVVPEKCYLNIYIRADESSYVLEINYMKGKFIAEKNFPVNQKGVEAMEEIKNQYKSELDFRRYFEII
jgi:hypothetical protein